MDGLAFGRPNTASILPIGRLQERGLQIVTCLDHLRRELDILALLRPGDAPVAYRTLIRAITMDYLNLLEHIWELPKQSRVRGQLHPMIAIAKQIGLAGSPVLTQTAHIVREPWFPQLVSLRNKACAHLDRNATLADLVGALDRVDTDVLHTLVDGVHQIFRTFCRADIRTTMFLIHDEPLRNVVRVFDRGTAKPF